MLQSWCKSHKYWSITSLQIGWSSQYLCFTYANTVHYFHFLYTRQSCTLKFVCLILSNFKSSDLITEAFIPSLKYLIFYKKKLLVHFFKHFRFFAHFRKVYRNAFAFTFVYAFFQIIYKKIMYKQTSIVFFCAAMSKTMNIFYLMHF